MGERISYFSNYSQKENRTTNYLLVLFKAIYNESPLLFDKLMQDVLDNDEISFIPLFEQQTKAGTSKNIADGKITLKPSKVIVEAKLDDWHYKEQIEGYAKSFVDDEGAFIVLIANFESKKSISEIIEECNKSNEKVKIVALGYDEIIAKVKKLAIKSDYLHTMLDEFVEYAENNGLLPTWKRRFIVRTSGDSIERNIKDKYFSCPNTGGGYSHRRAMFFGLYNYKTVDNIAEIHACVVVKIGDKPKIVWHNAKQKDEMLIHRANEIANLEDFVCKKGYLNGEEQQIFLLGEISNGVNFRKSTKMSIQNKKYFMCQDEIGMSELIKLISNKTWEDFEDGTLQLKKK